MKCPHCKNEIPADSKFCPDCGNQLDNSKTSKIKLDVDVKHLLGVRPIIIEERGINGIPLYGTIADSLLGNNDYSGVRNSMLEWQNCRICTMADNNQCVAIYGTNGYSFQGNTCKDGIIYANRGGHYIEDLNVVKSGAYIVIFDRNGFFRAGIPSRFEKRLMEDNKNGENIYSASFNDKGEYCIVTEKYVHHSNGLTDFLQRAKERFGYRKYVFISDVGRVAICQGGIYFENMPLNVVQTLNKIDFVPDYIKFTDSGYFSISNKDGKCSFYLK